MATRNLQFFGTRAETLSLVAKVAEKLTLHLALYRDHPEPELRALTAEDAVQQAKEFNATRVFLSREPMKLSKIDPERIMLARLQWLMVDLPRIKHGQLLMAGLSTKSDWFDVSTNEVHQAPETLKFFKCISAEFKPRLAFPVWAWHRISKEAVAYKDLGYMAGAKQFVEAGGELAQEGVPNLIFALAQPEL